MTRKGACLLVMSAGPAKPAVAAATGYFVLRGMRREGHVPGWLTPPAASIFAGLVPSLASSAVSCSGVPGSRRARRDNAAAVSGEVGHGPLRPRAGTGPMHVDGPRVTAVRPRKPLKAVVAVGTPFAGGPPHRSGRAGLPHTALTSGAWRRNGRWVRVQDLRSAEPEAPPDREGWPFPLAGAAHSVLRGRDGLSRGAGGSSAAEVMRGRGDRDGLLAGFLLDGPARHG
jgi:hypothetical protein